MKIDAGIYIRDLRNSVSPVARGGTLTKSNRETQLSDPDAPEVAKLAYNHKLENIVY